MDFEKIKSKIEQAKASIEAANLPEDLRKIAFEKLMDKILESEKGTRKASSPKRIIPKKKSKEVSTDSSDKNAEEVQKIINSLSRSKHAIIFELEKTLDQALYILKIAEEEIKIGELAPKQISDILKETFRISRTPEAISMALLHAKSYSDRRKIIINGVISYKYKIMHEGEEYIKNKITEVGDRKQNG